MLTTIQAVNLNVQSPATRACVTNRTSDGSGGVFGYSTQVSGSNAAESQSKPPGLPERIARPACSAEYGCRRIGDRAASQGRLFAPFMTMLVDEPPQLLQTVPERWIG